MGFRFRKSINLGGVRVNLSKSGIGYSVGTKGARITKTANGRTRTTLSIPNTGLSYVSESSKKKKNYNKNNTKTYVNADEINKDGCKTLAWVCRILYIPMIIIGLLLYLVEPSFGLAGVVIGILELIYSKLYFNKSKIEKSK